MVGPSSRLSPAGRGSVARILSKAIEGVHLQEFRMERLEERQFVAGPLVLTSSGLLLSTPYLFSSGHAPPSTRGDGKENSATQNQKEPVHNEVLLAEETLAPAGRLGMQSRLLHRLMLPAINTNHHRGGRRTYCQSWEQAS